MPVRLMISSNIIAHFDWHRRCVTPSVTIKRAATVLLLVTMAAAPVTSAACVGWCFPAETPTTTACHHGSATLAIKGGEENCDSVLAVSPFLKEEIQLVTHAVLPASTTLSAFVSAPEGALLAYGRDVDTAYSRRATSPLVLRL